MLNKASIKTFVARAVFSRSVSTRIVAAANRCDAINCFNFSASLLQSAWVSRATLQTSAMNFARLDAFNKGEAVIPNIAEPLAVAASHSAGAGNRCSRSSSSSGNVLHYR